MSTLNLQVFSIAYSDTTISNNPQLRNFDLSWKMLGQSVNNPISTFFSIPPGTQQKIFSGVRTTSIDNTTAFTITQPYPSQPNTYRFTNSGGTAPIFRTSRNIGVDDTSVIQVSLNGPIAVYTSTSGTMMNTGSVVVGDILNIGSGAGFSQSNSGTFIVLAITSTSLSVQNLNGVTQTATIADPTQFLVYSNGGGSSNQIQIGDKAVISSSFSPVIFGTYTVANVTPGYFEINVGAPNGIPLQSSVTPGTSGIVFYSLAKSFLLIAAQQTCTLQINGDTSGNVALAPTTPNVPQSPALYMQQGLVYSLDVTNTSLETLNIQIASVE